VLRKSLALFAIVIPLVLAACGSDDSTSSTTSASDTSSTESTTEASTTASGGSGAGGTVAISETEFKLDPSDPTVKAGSVTFDVSNDGTTTHNLEVEGDGVEEETDDLDAGSSGQLTVDLKPGTYEIYCSIDGHKDLGMEGELTVQ